MLCRRLLSPAGLLAGIILFWLASVPLSCLGGPVSLTLPEIWSVFAGMAGFGESAVDPVARSVISEIRLSRAVLALLCGGTLAVAGVALQGVLRNPLADPFTLGISSGAACGASIAIALGGSLGLTVRLGANGMSLISLCALIGALLALAGTLWLGRGDGGFRRETVILAGIAMSRWRTRKPWWAARSACWPWRCTGGLSTCWPWATSRPHRWACMSVGPASGCWRAQAA